jgi:hypothetical protein
VSAEPIVRKDGIGFARLFSIGKQQELDAGGAKLLHEPIELGEGGRLRRLTARLRGLKLVALRRLGIGSERSRTHHQQGRAGRSLHKAPASR